MRHTTLLFLLRDNQILLAMKKRGFGAGRWNGVGGKIEAGEGIEQAAIRECTEEIGVTPGELQKVAHLTFTSASGRPDVVMHVFVSSTWHGEPIETEEMAPQWFDRGIIPYDDMWQDDKLWLPLVLQGKKVRATFGFDAHDNILPHLTTIETVSEVA